MKKSILFLLLIFLYHPSFSQFSLKGTVKDSKTKQPISFCAITIKGSDKGTISNEDGEFSIVVQNSTDRILFSFIGYEKKEILAETLLKTPMIELVPANYTLSEAVIHGNDNYLYTVVQQCRKKILSSDKHTSKVYFLMQTDILNSPAEILECYYNGTASAHALDKLSLKNGRIGLAETVNHGFFLSENTAHVLPMMDLVKENSGLPGLPFQMSERKLKKIYLIDVGPSPGDETILHIKFFPKHVEGKYFHGEAWIDKNTFDLMRINLSIDSAEVHPFVAVWHEDQLENVSLSFSETFTRKKDSILFPEHIHFSYTLSYHANMAYRANVMMHLGPSPDTAERVQEIYTSGSLTFYDFDNSFYLPHYSYDEDATVYKKILSFPFNENFWKHEQLLLYTDKQQKAMQFFNANGVLINYRSNAAMNKVGHVAKQFFEGTNIFWTDSQRISLSHDGLQTALKKDSLSKTLTFRIDQYHLETQIFLDVNLEHDSVKHFSSSVFDVNKSFYNLPSEPFTDCLMNIYFDLTEVGRRKMESRLDSNSFTPPQIDSVYSVASTGLKQQQELFIKETESGMNAKGLSKWNDYIADILGIDNMKIFGLK
jgi:hypothetical protein